MKYIRLACLLVMAATCAAMVPARADEAIVGGSYRDCHGYILHVSLANIRVHCIDGKASDMSFVSWPKFANLQSGHTIQTTELKENTPVHVIFTQSLGIRHAYKIYVADPKGNGLYGFKS
jgi:hypothetical protein